MFLRVFLLITCLALAASAPASAIYKSPTDCRMVYESFNWNEVKHTKMITRAIGSLEYWRGPALYQWFDFEQRESPHGEHGKVGWMVYHTEYEPAVEVWCGAVHS